MTTKIEQNEFVTQQEADELFEYEMRLIERIHDVYNHRDD